MELLIIVITLCALGVDCRAIRAGQPCPTASSEEDAAAWGMTWEGVV